MKVFVIKGSIKGMVKIDNRLHLSGENIDSVDKVILACGQDIKVVSRTELNSQEFILKTFSFLILGAIFGVFSHISSSSSTTKSVVQLYITSCGELDHIILGRDEDISGGVDFIMQNFDEKKVQTNFTKLQIIHINLIKVAVRDCIRYDRRNIIFKNYAHAIVIIRIN